MSETKEPNPRGTLTATGVPFQAAGDLTFSTIAGFTMTLDRYGDELRAEVRHEGRPVGHGFLHRVRQTERFAGQVDVHGSFWWCEAVRDEARRSYAVEFSAQRVPLKIEG